MATPNTGLSMKAIMDRPMSAETGADIMRMLQQLTTMLSAGGNAQQIAGLSNLLAGDNDEEGEEGADQEEREDDVEEIDERDELNLKNGRRKRLVTLFKKIHELVTMFGCEIYLAVHQVVSDTYVIYNSSPSPDFPRPYKALKHHHPPPEINTPSAPDQYLRKALKQLEKENARMKGKLAQVFQGYESEAIPGVAPTASQPPNPVTPKPPPVPMFKKNSPLGGTPDASSTPQPRPVLGSPITFGSSPGTQPDNSIAQPSLGQKRGAPLDFHHPILPKRRGRPRKTAPVGPSPAPIHLSPAPIHPSPVPVTPLPVPARPSPIPFTPPSLSGRPRSPSPPPAPKIHRPKEGIYYEELMYRDVSGRYCRQRFAPK